METEKENVSREALMIAQRLRAPFPLSELDIRQGPKDYNSGKVQPLFYIDSRAVIKRLDQVFGVGQYDIRTNRVEMAEDSKWPRQEKGKEPPTRPTTTGLLVATEVSITVRHPMFACTVSNVGEKGLDEAGYNKVTSSWAQAFKRAASLLGIGAYLYYMGNVGYHECKNGKFDVKALGLDVELPKALKEAGFYSRCEVSGEEIDWKSAATSVHYTGRVLSIEEAKKVLEQMGLRKAG